MASSFFQSSKSQLTITSSVQFFPLFVAMGVAVRICSLRLIRNITTNPEVRDHLSKSVYSDLKISRM
ncbi:hypothetical protein Syun_014094 [Stephania yunnanensis]|uniref:Uncharacterized protein n=1 Tax=Stephania yunnanensis TaxID=152371 RepID=A0AAP0JJ38_9MAGN